MHNFPEALSHQFLYWYRYLLREATYLPDPFARDHFRQTIVRRFRAYAPRKPEPRPKSVFEPERQRTLLRKCRKALCFLGRANAGDIPSLRKALQLTYGRSGQRKHALLRPWLEPEIPLNSTAVESLSASLSEPPRPRLSIPPALRAIAKAQHERGYAAKFSGIKHPKLPAKNNWGRPMPRRRAGNMMRKAYLSLIRYILPPLPDAEYERVRSIAFGEQHVEPTIERRGSLSSALLAEVGTHRVFHDGKLQRGASELQVQRAYRDVFLLSSKMERDASANRWLVRWAAERDFMTQRSGLEAKPEDAFLFGAKSERETPPADRVGARLSEEA